MRSTLSIYFHRLIDSNDYAVDSTAKSFISFTFHVIKS